MLCAVLALMPAMCASSAGEAVFKSAPTDDNTAFDHAGQRRVQLFGVHIVLVLAHADGFGVDLDQLGQRVLQAPRNRNRAAQRHVQPRAAPSRPAPTRNRPTRPTRWSSHRRRGRSCSRSSSAAKTSLSFEAVPFPMDRMSTLCFFISCAERVFGLLGLILRRRADTRRRYRPPAPMSSTTAILQPVR